ncbi:MAG: serine hydrolase domain-containing protein [Enterococcus sp.]
MYEQTKKMILQKMTDGIYPGVVASFIKGEQRECLVAGAAQLIPEPIAMDEEMLFDVASLTKVIATTTMVLKLIEDNKLKLDEPLHTYLPDFTDQTITIRHLLTHTSDIQTWIENRDQLTQEELISAYLKLQPGENLGKVVKYTDAGTILLGFMLENLYQEELTELFQDEVLMPLGMYHSYFLPFPSSKIVPTQQQADGTVLKGVTHDPKARVLAEHAGNAGLFTSIEDIERFVHMYLNRGQIEHGTFLNAETIDMLLQDQTPTHEGKRSLGWDLRLDLVDQHPILFHTGYTGTFLLIDIVEQEAFIFLSNRIHPKDNREEYIKNRDEIIENFLKEKALLKKSAIM